MLSGGMRVSEILSVNIYLGLENPDIGQIAVKLVIIEPVAHDEFVGHLKA